MSPRDPLKIRDEMRSTGLENEARAWDQGSLDAEYGPTPSIATPSAMDYAGDLALAGPRAGLSTVQGVYDLVDAVSFDLLPDLDIEFLGSSKYIPGKISQMGSEIALAMLSGYGATGAVASFLPKIGTVLSKGTLARSAVAGMFGDAIMTDSPEGTLLASVLNQAPELQNPVLDFLAADEDDPKALIKLKGAVEGLGLGLAFDALFRGLRLMKTAYVSRARGESLEKITSTLDQVGKDLEMKPPSPEADLPSIEEARSVLEEGGLSAQALDDDLATRWGFSKESDPLAEELAGGPSRAELEEAKRVGGEVQAEKDTLDELGALPGGEALPQKTNPRKQTLEEQGAHRTTNLKGNLTVRASTEAVAKQHRSLERHIYEEVRGTTVASKASLVKQNKAMIEGYAGKPVTQVLSHASRAGDDLDRVLSRVLADTYMADSVAAQLVDYNTLAGMAKTTREKALYLMRRDELTIVAREFEDEVQRTRTQWSRLGNLTGTKIRGRKVQVQPGGEVAPFKRGKGGRADVSDAPESAREKIRVDRYIEEFGEEGISAEAKQYAALHKRKDTLARMRAMEATKDGLLQKFARKANTLWIHGLLQRPTTFMVNFNTTAANALLLPLEHALGGAMTGKWDELRFGLDQFNAAFQGMFSKTNLEAGWDTFKTAESHLIPGHAPIDSEQVLDSLGTIDMKNRVLGVAHAAWTAGSRGLIGTDEFFKRGMFISHMKAQGLRKGRALFPTSGIPYEEAGEMMRKQQQFAAEYADNSIVGKTALTGEKIEELAEDRLLQLEVRAKNLGDEKMLETLNNPTARYKLKGELFDEMWDPAFDKDVKNAVEYAKVGSFTKDPVAGTLGADVNNMVNSHPMLRWFMPFVRTPLNIVKQVMDHLNPVGPIAVGVKKKWGLDLIGLEKTHNQFVQDFMGEGATHATKAQAIGRLTTGLGVTGLAFKLASEGGLTGRGPADPGQRATMREAGWHPYSIQKDGKYYSYQRFAPFGMYLGIAADMNDAFRLAGPEEQDTVSTLFYGMITATAQNLTSQTYLTGLKNLVNLMTDPTVSGPSMTRQMAGSLIPGGVSQFVGVQDDNLRDVRSIQDAWMNKIPFLSDNLSPRRNVLGEPVTRTKALGQDTIGSIQRIWMPVAYSETTDDAITREMASLQHGFAPPGVRKGGINLHDHRSPSGQTAYDRWQELQGQVRISGRSIRQDLGRLISSREYQRLPREGTPEQESFRLSKVRTVISRYRREAYKQMLREFPAIGAADAARKMARQNPYAIL